MKMDWVIQTIFDGYCSATIKISRYLNQHRSEHRQNTKCKNVVWKDFVCTSVFLLCNSTVFSPIFIFLYSLLLKLRCYFRQSDNFHLHWNLHLWICIRYSSKFNWKIWSWDRLDCIHFWHVNFYTLTKVVP